MYKDKINHLRLNSTEHNIYIFHLYCQNIDIVCSVTQKCNSRKVNLFHISSLQDSALRKSVIAQKEGTHPWFGRLLAWLTTMLGVFFHIHSAETRSSSLRNCLFGGEEDEDIALQKWFLRTGGQSESWMTMTQFAFCLRIERGDFFFSLSLSPSLGESRAPSSAQRTRQSSFLFSFSVHTTWIVLLSDFVFFLHSSQGPTANMEPLCRQSYTIFE